MIRITQNMPLNRASQAGIVAHNMLDDGGPKKRHFQSMADRISPTAGPSALTLKEHLAGLLADPDRLTLAECMTLCAHSNADIATYCRVTESTVVRWRSHAKHPKTRCGKRLKELYGDMLDMNRFYDPAPTQDTLIKLRKAVQVFSRGQSGTNSLFNDRLQASTDRTLEHFGA